MQKLLDVIEKNKAELSEKINKRDEQLAFYQDLFRTNDYNNINYLIQADQKKLVAIIMMTNKPELNVGYVSNVLELNKEILEMKIQDLDTLLHLLESYVEDEEAYEMLIDIFQNRKDTILNRLHPFRHLFRFYNISEENFALFMELFKKCFPFSLKAYITILGINAIKEEVEEHKEGINNVINKIPLKIKVKKRDQEKIINKTIKHDWNLTALYEPLKTAKAYYEEKLKEEKSNRNHYLKLLKSFEKLKEKVQNAYKRNEEVKFNDELFGNITDSNFRRFALQEIYLYNKKIYDKTNEEYQSLVANSLLKYQALLTEYGITLEENALEAVMKNSVEDLKEMINILKEIKVLSQKDISIIIQTSNLETIKYYKSLMENGIIKSDLLLENLDLFNKESVNSKNLMSNLALIQEIKLNPYLFQLSQKTLIISHEIFKNSINTLTEYKLLEQTKTGMNYSFLENSKLASSIDTLLELGFEEYLEKDIEILNYYENFKRLRLLKSLNIEVSSKEELLNVLTNDKFFVPDNQIEDYIYNAVSYKLSSEEVLEGQRTDNVYLLTSEDCTQTLRTYNIDGVIFSKNKFIKNLSQISENMQKNDRLFYALIKDTILTDDELNLIKKKVLKSNANTDSNKKLII